MDFIFFAAPVFLTLLIPVSLVMATVPLLLIWSFGRNSWASRRALAAHIAFGIIGYLVSLAYYAIVGIPEGASSIFNVSSFGAFFGAGYGGIGSVIYFWRHRNNPARTSTAIVK